MKLLILLACLGIQRYMNFNFSLSQYDWFTPYQDMLKQYVPKQLMNGVAGLVVLVVPIALIAMIVGMVLSGWWVTSFLYGLVVLFYCLDGRLGEQFIQAQSGAGGTEPKSEADVAASQVLEEPVPNTSHAKVRAISNAIFTHSLHHVFGVIFWYVVLGIFGAITYFLVAFIANPPKKTQDALAPYADSAKLVLDILAWVPVRLVGLAFAIAGATANTIKVLTQHLVGKLSNEKDLAAIFGLTAIKADVENPNSATAEENKNAMTMVFLGQGVWLAVILVITLLSLVF